MKFINSGGGAYLVMTEQDAAKWPGANDMDVYDSIPFGADEGLITTVAGFNVIVLGMPDPLTCGPLLNGGFFATAVYSDDQESSVNEMMSNFPTEDWNLIGSFKVTGPLVVFDSANAGATDGMSLKIPAGNHDVFSLTHQPNEHSEFQLLKLQLISKS